MHTHNCFGPGTLSGRKDREMLDLVVFYNSQGHLSGSVGEHWTPDPRIMSSSPLLGGEPT